MPTYAPSPATFTTSPLAPLTTNQTWVGANAGAAISGFAKGSLAKTGGDHPDVQGWYAWFLQNIVLPNVRGWSYLIAFGEFLVGIALILGLFTGIAAFFGSFMNVNYLLAGTVSTNPILFAIATWLVLSWKTAGWWGLDRWILPVYCFSFPVYNPPHGFHRCAGYRNHRIRPRKRLNH